MDAIGALGATQAGGGGGAGANAFRSPPPQAFVKIIFSELGHQDPMAPSDSKALLEQLSSLRNIQSSMDLSSSMGALVAENQLSAASGLIGKSISGITEGAQRVTGVVKSVSRTGGGAILNLVSGAQVRMSNVDLVLGDAA